MDQENNPQQPPSRPQSVPPQMPNQGPLPPQPQPQPPNQFQQPSPSFSAGQTPGYTAKPPGRGSKKIVLFIVAGFGLVALLAVVLFVLYSVFSRIDPKLQAIADSIGMECMEGQLQETVDLVNLDLDINIEDIGLQDTPFVCTWEDVEVRAFTRSDAELIFPFILKTFAAENSEEFEAVKLACEDENLRSRLNTAFNSSLSTGIVGGEEYVFWPDPRSKTQEFRDALEDADIDTDLTLDVCESLS